MVFGTALAGTLMLLGGLWGVIVGLAALSTNHVYWANPGGGYYYHWTNHGWGWVELILGIVVATVGVCVFLGIAVGQVRRRLRGGTRRDSPFHAYPVLAGVVDRDDRRRRVYHLGAAQPAPGGRRVLATAGLAGNAAP